jgi:hypothetical protein
MLAQVETLPGVGSFARLEADFGDPQRVIGGDAAAPARSNALHEVGEDAHHD